MIGSALAKAAALLVAYAALALAFGLLSLRVVGLSGYVVMGGSEALLPVGSFVLFAPVAADAVRVGDLITVALPDRLLTERVVAIERKDDGARFTLRGGATASPDPVVVGPAPVVGKPHVAIPVLGYAVSYAEAYTPPAVLGLLIWFLCGVVARAFAPHVRVMRSRMVI